MRVPLLDLKAQYALIRNDIRAAVDGVFESQQFILGPTVEALEKRLAQYCGAKHAVGMASGSDALLASLMALGIGAGDEVICPTFSFFATAGAIARTGAKPVFLDVESQGLNLDVRRLEAAMTPRTKAIVPVHLFGQLAEMEPLLEIARARKLAVVEDAAQAIGARRNGKPAGAWGDLACFSFFPSKNLGGAGDGGLVVTDRDDLAAKLRILRDHGQHPRYHHSVVGGNFRLDALQAAVLSAKLPYLEKWHAGRRTNAERYGRLLAGTPVKTPVVLPGNESIFHQYTIRAPRRDDLQKFLTDAGVGTAIYYPVPLHLQECFANLGYVPGALPVSEQAAHEVLSLPIYPELTGEQIDYVGAKIREFYGAGR